MEGRLIALKLFLDSLGVPSAIDTVSDRKRVQKAVYLGQLAGPDLGYRFNWYVMGPYSPALTRDYYELGEAVESAGESIAGKTLKSDAVERLQRVKPVLNPPADVRLEQENWLELLASYHFLRRVSGYDHARSVELLKTQKAHVASYVDRAAAALKGAGLLS